MAGFGRVTRAVFADISHNIFDGFSRLISPQIVREMIVRMMLTQVSVELIKAMFARQTTLSRPNVTESPFPDQSSSVSGRLQHLGNS
jgi:hypothetical protein